MPEKNRTKINRELGRPMQLAQKIIFVRFWLTETAKQSFLAGYVKDQSTYLIRQGEKLVDQSDQGDFFGES